MVVLLFSLFNNGHTRAASSNLASSEMTIYEVFMRPAYLGGYTEGHMVCLIILYIFSL